MAGFMVKEYAPIYHDLTAHAEMQGGVFVGVNAAGLETKAAAVTEPAYFHVLELTGAPELVPDDRTATLAQGRHGKFKRLVPGEVGRAHVSQDMADKLAVGDRMNCLFAKSTVTTDIDQFIVTRKLTWAGLPAIEFMSVSATGGN